MTKLQLSKEVALPLDALTQKFDIMGQSGGGKTYAAMRLAELMLEAGGQVVVIDTVGPWWGLRASADGKKAGFPILVAGGLKGDLPLSASVGRQFADLVVEEGVSIVLDVSQLLEEEMYRFVAEFLERFFHLKRSNMMPVHVFIEECQEIIPETSTSRGQQHLRAIAIRMMKIGRNYGIGWTAITQEPQAAAKRALNQAGTIIAVRTVGKHERDALAGWAKSKAKSKDDLALMDVLPELKQSQALLWSPGWLGHSGIVHITPKVTFDSSKTPEVGQKALQPKVLAPMDMERLKASMGEVVATAEANDPVKLKAEIIKLRTELAKKPAPAPAPAKPAKRVQVPVFKRDEVKRLERLAKEMADGLIVFSSAVDGTRKLLADAKTIAGVPLTLNVEAMEREVHQHYKEQSQPTRAVYPGNGAARVPLNGLTAPAPLPKLLPVVGDEFKLTGKMRDIVSALAGLGSMTKDQLALFVGMTAGGGGFNNYLGALRTAQILTGSDRLRLVAIPEGIEAVKPTYDRVLDQWRSRLSPEKVVSLLNAITEGGKTKEQLAEYVGMDPGGGGFNNYLGKLRTSGLIEKDGDVFHLSSFIRNLPA